ncbi:hypothetical protein PR048_024356 [Dryococelus australis]|uniref:Uncharacterized protein n=1 Tax=Dryococelus australis TaxID=614101 RepID=A0ABQ9GNE5_9NEOP|nr:hypothetical protein PR048_024356 [Dryococelus australis]
MLKAPATRHAYIPDGPFIKTTSPAISRQHQEGNELPPGGDLYHLSFTQPTPFPTPELTNPSHIYQFLPQHITPSQTSQAWTAYPLRSLHTSELLTVAVLHRHFGARPHSYVPVICVSPCDACGVGLPLLIACFVGVRNLQCGSTCNDADTVLLQEAEDESTQGRGGRRSAGKRVSTIARTAQEGEALLKGLGHKEEGGGVEVENRRRTRSSTRGVPPRLRHLPSGRRGPLPVAPEGADSLGKCVIESEARLLESVEWRVCERAGGSRRGRPRKEEEEEEEVKSKEEAEEPAEAETNDKEAAPTPEEPQQSPQNADQEADEEPAKMEVDPPQQDGEQKDQPAENAVEDKQVCLTPTITISTANWCWYKVMFLAISPHSITCSKASRASVASAFNCRNQCDLARHGRRASAPSQAVSLKKGKAASEKKLLAKSPHPSQHAKASSESPVIQSKTTLRHPTDLELFSERLEHHTPIDYSYVPILYWI